MAMKTHFYCWSCHKHQKAIANNGEITCPYCHQITSIPSDDTPCINCHTSPKDNKTNWGYLTNAFVAWVSSASVKNMGKTELLTTSYTHWNTTKHYDPNRMVRFLVPICKICYEKDQKSTRTVYVEAMGVALLGFFVYSRHFNWWISLLSGGISAFSALMVIVQLFDTINKDKRLDPEYTRVQRMLKELTGEDSGPLKITRHDFEVGNVLGYQSTNKVGLDSYSFRLIQWNQLKDWIASEPK